MTAKGDVRIDRWTAKLAEDMKRRMEEEGMRDAARRRQEEPRSSHEDPGQVIPNDQVQLSDEMPNDLGNQEQDDEQSELQETVLMTL